MASADTSGRSFSERDHGAHLRRAMIASTVGTTFEWYDFLLYGQLTAPVFGKLFFPKSDPLVGVLEAFAVFFYRICRPADRSGDFRPLGDRIGRKATLIATLLVTGLATVAVGLVPTYESIGIWGAVLLTIIRLSKASGSAANGAARSCWRWNWREPIRTAASLPHGRNSGRRPGSSWPIWRC